MKTFTEVVATVRAIRAAWSETKKQYKCAVVAIDAAIDAFEQQAAEYAAEESDGEKSEAEKAN